MRGQDEIHVFEIVEVFQKGVSGLRGLGGIGARVQFVEYAKVATRRRGVALNGVQNVFATSRFGLKERVSFRRVGNIQVRVNVGIRVQDTLGVKAAADLLRENDIDGRGFQKGRLAARIGSRKNHILVQAAAIGHTTTTTSLRTSSFELGGGQEGIDLAIHARGALLDQLGGMQGAGVHMPADAAQIVEESLEAKAIEETLFIVGIDVQFIVPL